MDVGPAGRSELPDNVEGASGQSILRAMYGEARVAEEEEAETDASSSGASWRTALSQAVLSEPPWEAEAAESGLRARVLATSNIAPPRASFRSAITLYHVHVESGDKRWSVRRRYSEFRKLATELQSLIGNRMAGLPPKLVRHAADDVAARLLVLDMFLRSLLELRPHPALLHTFLGSNVGTEPPSSSRESNGAALDSGEVWKAEDGSPRVCDAAGPEQGTPLFLLSGTWIADEERSRDTLEPLLVALQTPAALIELLRDVTIVTSVVHTAGVTLVERTSSSFGEAEVRAVTVVTAVTAVTTPRVSARRRCDALCCSHARDARAHAGRRKRQCRFASPVCPVRHELLPRYPPVVSCILMKVSCIH